MVALGDSSSSTLANQSTLHMAVLSSGIRRSSHAGHRPERTKEAVLFIIGSGGEKQGIHVPRAGPVAKTQPPQPINRHGVGTIRELTQKTTAGWVEGADPPVAKIADEDCSGETVEARRCVHDSPRRVQCPLRGEASHEPAVGIEDV